MKISNSKKQLAKIISENGGWREGAEFAAQCTKGEIGFWHDKPTKSRGEEWRGSYLGTANDIKFSGEGVGSWAQITLSSDEYFHLYPAPDADGWIEWNGGECPVGEKDIIDIKLRDGEVWTGKDSSWRWCHDGHMSDIIAYRLHRPEQVRSTAVGDDKTNLAAKEELEVMEYRTSIEQLAADYRNAKDYADRKQQEADAANADVEAKLDELVAAGKAHGLVLGVAAPEPDMVITDWRDLLVGDVVMCVEDNIGGKYNGTVGKVLEVDLKDRGTPIRASLNDNDYGIWCHEVKFIRRP